MKTKLISLLLALMLVLSLAAPVCASTPPYLYDEAGLLSGSEAAALSSRLAEVSTAAGLDVVVLTTKTPAGKTAEAYADDFYDSHGFGQGANHDGILLLICSESRDWALSTCGYAITAFTDAGLDYMAEQMIPDLRDGNWAGAFHTYATLCEDFAQQARTGKPYDVGHMPKAPFPIVLALVLSLLAAFLIALIVSLILRGKMKSVRAQNTAASYLIPGSLHMTRSRDTFLYHKVDRTRRESNNSHGGSSTHISSSGVTHGGRSGKF